MPVRFDTPVSTLPVPAIVTGASGFVGRQLVATLAGNAFPVALGEEGWRERIAAAPWRKATVYHLAARVHQDKVDEKTYEEDNVGKTIALAEAAAAGGAGRLVFLSTIKVHGEETIDRPFSLTDTPAPVDGYSRSKWNAEQALAEIMRRTGLSVAIVRSPLVVGAGAVGNLRALMGLVDGPWPLPFAAIRNRRTFICVEDLAQLLCACGRSPNASGRTYLAGDARSLSTTELVVALRRAWQRPQRLFAMDSRVLESMAAWTGQSQRMRRLTRSLEIDASETARDLSWRPFVGVEKGIDRMALAYRQMVPT
jgi:nucleoside-diphosphate-sugar epimerase